MAPRKKGGKKGGGKKKEKEKADENVGEGEAVSELDKYYYLTQIEGLETQIHSLTTRCTLLEQAESEARLKHDQLLQDKVDVTSFLRNRLKARNDEVEELRSRLQGLLKAGDEERKQCQAQLNDQEKSAEERQLDLNDRLIALTRQLDSLEEFRQNKEQMEARLKELESTLEKERHQHQEEISILERSTITESDKLRSEVEQRVSALAGRFRKAAAAEMHSTTRRALHHNQALTSVLATLRSRLLHLREENHKLRDSLQEIKIKENLQNKIIDGLTTKSQKRGDLLKKLTERAEQHSRQHIQDMKQLKETEQLRKDLRLQQAQLDATTELITQLKEKATERDIALELTATRLHEEDAMKKSLLNCIRSALQILQKAMFEESAEKETDSGEEVSKNVLLKKLVELLTIQEEKVTSEQISDFSREIKCAPDPLLTYAAGDLGFLPKTSRKTRRDSAKS